MLLEYATGSTNRESRHANSTVVFDAQSGQLILRNPDRDLDQAVTDSNCPHCGRPYDDPNSAIIDDDINEEQQPTFINSQYFRMLASSLPGSNRSSAPPSPRRRLAQPVRSSPLGSNAAVPPPGAEFVGSSPAPPDSSHPISETAFASNYFERFFVIEKELGRGGRGVVLLVKHVLDNVALGHFACKRVPVGDDHTWLEKVLVEVQALQSLSHQNLVSYRHVWLEDYQINDFSPRIPCAFILQQYCNGGDLHTYVCAPAQVQSTAQELKERIRRKSRGEAEMPRKLNEPRKLSFDQIYSFFLDITEGIRFLHLNGFIHRDLKPSNCLLHQVGGDTRVLVSDFGEVQYENAIRKSTGHTGTISYCAPEVLKPVSPGGPLGNFTFKSDIFSLGMILHFLCFADLPYHHANVLQEENEDLVELRDEIMSWPGFDQNWKKRPDLPNRLYTFLKQLLSISPESRPSADDVLNGIRAGGLENVPELKRRSSATTAGGFNSMDDATPAKGRITRIESPLPGTLTSRQSHPAPRELDTTSPTRQSQTQIRKRGPRSPSLAHSQLSFNHSHRSGTPDADSGADSPQLGPQSRNNSSSNLTALAMRRSSSHGLPRSPPLQPASAPRPNTNVSGSLPPQNPRKRIVESPDAPRLLLPAPPRSSQLESLQRGRGNLLRYKVDSITVPIAIFAAKLMSVIQPCLNEGMNSNIFYIVFALAVLELATMPQPVWRLVLLAVMHVGILIFADQRGLWCRSREARWAFDP